MLVRLVLPPGFAFPTGWGWWLRPAKSAVVENHFEDVSEAPQGEMVATGTVNQRSPEAALVGDVASMSPEGSDGQLTEDRQFESSSVVAEARAGAAPTLSWNLLLMIGWACIVATRLGMLLTAALQVRVWVMRARPIVDPALSQLFADCQRRTGVRRRVQIRNSESCTTPLVVGFWRPVILLPAAVL